MLYHYNSVIYDPRSFEIFIEYRNFQLWSHFQLSTILLSFPFLSFSSLPFSTQIKIFIFLLSLPSSALCLHSLFSFSLQLSFYSLSALISSFFFCPVRYLLSSSPLTFSFLLLSYLQLINHTINISFLFPIFSFFQFILFISTFSSKTKK